MSNRSGLWFDMLTWADAKALRAWWHSNNGWLWCYAIRPSPSNSRYWALYREAR